jgi:hypothetical protein
VVDVEIVTGEEHDTHCPEQRLDAIEQAPGRSAGRITADASYGIGRVYAALEERDTDHVIPHRKPVRRRDSSGFPIERFKYDARPDIVRCPARKILTPRNRTRSCQVYRADRKDCAGCPLRQRCIPGSAPPDGSISPDTTPPSCGPAADGCDGPKPSAPSTPVTDGRSKAPTALQRRSTDWREPFAVGSRP